MTSLRLEASVADVRKRVIYSTTRAMRSKAPMEQLVTKARDEANRATRYFLRVEPPNPPLACHEGCSNCCSQRVRASVPEVLAVAAFIRVNFEPDRTEALGRLIAEDRALPLVHAVEARMLKIKRSLKGR